MPEFLPAPVEIVETKPVPALSRADVKVLVYIEQAFWETGLVPTAEKLSDVLELDILVVRRALRNDKLRTALAARGIDLVLTNQTAGKALQPKQIMLANFLLNLQDKRSLRQKLEQLEISPQQYYAWLRQPAYQEFLRKRGEALFSAHDYAAYAALIQNVTDGDNKALEMFFSMRGKYKTTIDINVNVDVVVRQLIEIVTKHVKDPIILEAIAIELEQLELIDGST